MKYPLESAQLYAAGTMLEILQNGTMEIGKSDLEPGEAAVVRLLRQQLDLYKPPARTSRRCVGAARLWRLPSVIPSG